MLCKSDQVPSQRRLVDNGGDGGPFGGHFGGHFATKRRFPAQTGHREMDGGGDRKSRHETQAVIRKRLSFS